MIKAANVPFAPTEGNKKINPTTLSLAENFSGEAAAGDCPECGRPMGPGGCDTCGK